MVAVPSQPQLCPLPTNGATMKAGWAVTNTALLMPGPWAFMPCLACFVTGIGDDLVGEVGIPLGVQAGSSVRSSCSRLLGFQASASSPFPTSAHLSTVFMDRCQGGLASRGTAACCEAHGTQESTWCAYMEAPDSAIQESPPHIPSTGPRSVQLRKLCGYTREGINITDCYC